MARGRKPWSQLPRSTQSYWRNRDVTPRRYEAERRRSPETRRQLDRLGVNRRARMSMPGSARNPDSALGRAVRQTRQQRTAHMRAARDAARRQGQPFGKREQAQLDAIRAKMVSGPDRPGRTPEQRQAFADFLAKIGAIDRPEDYGGS